MIATILWIHVRTNLLSNNSSRMSSKGARNTSSSRVICCDNRCFSCSIGESVSYLSNIKKTSWLYLSSFHFQQCSSRGSSCLLFRHFRLYFSYSSFTGFMGFPKIRDDSCLSSGSTLWRTSIPIGSTGHCIFLALFWGPLVLKGLIG